MIEKEALIPRHGGYRKLKSFQIARLIYDVTVRFCELYVDRFSRTRDQMVQAARSGVQNIAEGSQASATSKKTELKLTNVARARKLIEDLMMERMAENDKIVTRYMADQEFQGAAFPLLAREIFETIRTRGESIPDT